MISGRNMLVIKGFTRDKKNILQSNQTIVQTISAITSLFFNHFTHNIYDR